jgi:hypothetical protein
VTPVVAAAGKPGLGRRSNHSRPALKRTGVDPSRRDFASRPRIEVNSASHRAGKFPALKCARSERRRGRGELLSTWAGLRFVRLHLSLDRLVLAYATGYAVRARGLPLAEVGVTEVLMPLAYTSVGFALASAVRCSPIAS